MAVKTDAHSGKCNSEEKKNIFLCRRTSFDLKAVICKLKEDENQFLGGFWQLAQLSFFLKNAQLSFV